MIINNKKINRYNLIYIFINCIVIYYIKATYYTYADCSKFNRYIYIYIYNNLHYINYPMIINLDILLYRDTEQSLKFKPLIITLKFIYFYEYD